MKKYIGLIAALFVYCNASTQITITLSNSIKIPSQFSDSIFIAGNFNNWQPGDSAYKMNKLNDSLYQITINPGNINLIEFKFTRGSWETGETLQNGAFRANRSYHYTPGMSVTERVQNWQDIAPVIKKELNKNILTFSVFAPQLNKDKTIRIYLPCDYKISNNNYPVLYMLDAQNLFDNVYSYAGEWGIDEIMDSLCRLNFTASIIVGIDHAGDNRLTEYSPWQNHEYGGGEGDEFSEFVVKTLKPKIDSLYRTLPGRENTAIAGSSMGGLMSTYLVLKYNDIFSKAVIFSPAYWFSNESVSLAENYNSSLRTQLYFIAGGLEGDEYMNDMVEIFTILKNKNLPRHTFRLTVESQGTHNEGFWRKEFPKAYEWLLLDD